ncbi:hypothetical protein T265_15376, partial [Opisthorchis viverrini]
INDARPKRAESGAGHIINNKASVKPGISPLHTPNGLTATASAAAEELAEFYSTVYCQKEYISRMSFMSPSPPTSLHERHISARPFVAELHEVATASVNEVPSKNKNGRSKQTSKHG